MRALTSRFALRPPWLLFASFAVKIFMLFRAKSKAFNREERRETPQSSQREPNYRPLSAGNLQCAVQADLECRAFLQLQTAVAEQRSDDSCCSANVGAVAVPPAAR